jgi:hypothetical protein
MSKEKAMPDGMFAELTADGEVRITLPPSVLRKAEKGANGGLVLELTQQSATALRDKLTARLGGGKTDTRA